MGKVVLGIGDYGVSRDPAVRLKTIGLGSCVALILLDPKTRTVAMDHIALPDSEIDPKKAVDKPGYFSDTGIPLLLEEMARHGCAADGRGFIVKLVGGATMINREETFDIGKRNVLSIKKLLWQRRLGSVAEDVGGTICRNVEIEVATGRVVVTSPSRAGAVRV